MPHWTCPTVELILGVGLGGSVKLRLRETSPPLLNTFSSVQFSCSVMSDSLWPHESQHARPPCPLPTPRVHSNSCASSRWCHPAISSSVIPFCSCPQSLQASVFSNESALRMRWPKNWSFSFSISASNEHPGLISFRMDWVDLLAVQGTLRSLLQHHSSKASMLQCSAFFTVQLLQPFIVVSQNSGPGGPVDSARVSWATTLSQALCWTEEEGAEMTRVQWAS